MKKKSGSSIISSSYFSTSSNTIAASNTPKSSTPTLANHTAVEVTKSSTTDVNNENTTVNTKSKPDISIENAVGSALSIKGIQQKKALSKKRKVIVEDPTKLPKTPFTEAQALKLWNTYGKRMDKKGERIIGSMFAMNKPKLNDNFELVLELPNETMRLDIENIQTPLLAYMGEELNNYSITLKIVVNEAVAVKHAFTPQDKYDKLKEKNHFIDKLRAKFDLDL
ncbi:hypothetical protein [Aquimarina agarivorans]|uniref:hypothetical protein n=1 Tax=Aquimarina agarivorans TaxID=980584 RepID=UPI000248E888|nr:hypothetical protein [Aquimarina agarivorans]